MSDLPIPPASADAHALLLQHHPPALASTLLHEKIHNKPLALHPSHPAPAPNARDSRQRNRHTSSSSSTTTTSRPKPLTALEKRSLRVHAPRLSSLRYGTFLPLKALWVEYAQSLVAMGGGADAMAQRLAAGDLHGAEVEVVRCRCVDRVGIVGVVVKETKGVLVVVCEKGGGKTVPKEFTVFRVRIPPTADEKARYNRRDMVLDLHGQQMMFRAAERAGRKFKPKPMLEL
ncbi:Rof/RNase P-like protein [Sphaerosporella brunnea]|uniref:Ribonuclease P protein subunit n=1 Tax=Sphaerosporella brunnea TaxID=1250544 RepID=A0A5J5EUQ7_9PEZI|nr:Rof/RNase P-like protein [Sphaerosporella brunnea]